MRLPNFRYVWTVRDNRGAVLARATTREEARADARDLLAAGKTVSVYRQSVDAPTRA